MQLDNRSSFDFKQPLSEIEMQLIIKRFSKTKNLEIIGGPDTGNYLPEYKRRIGNIKYITQQILNCNMFIGCDSGISHIAGLLGTKMVIVPLGRHERVKEFYSGYKNTTIYSRNHLLRLPLL